MRIAYNPKTAGALSSAPANNVNDIIFDLAGLNIYANGVKFTGAYTTFKKETNSNTGYDGLVPAPDNTNDNTRYLREDGTWVIPTNTTYSVFTAATATAAGKLGLVLAPSVGDLIKFLRGDRTWTTITPELISAAPVEHTHTLSNISDLHDSWDPVLKAVTPEFVTRWPKWDEVTSKPTTFTPSSHTHLTSQITALTGYNIATSAAALATTDTLNTALGKLEYKADLAYTFLTAANDGDKTIENLKEILDVLAGIKDTDTILALLGKYKRLDVSEFYGDRVASKFWDSRIRSEGGGWAFTTILIHSRVDGVDTRVAAFGVRGEDDTLLHIYIGSNNYDSALNLRILPNGDVLANKFIGPLQGNSDSASTSTKLTTARKLWGQTFDGTADVSGNMTGVGTISASGNIGITKTSATTTGFYAKNSVGEVNFIIDGSGNRGVYDRTNENWIIADNGTNTFLNIGNVGIGTTSPTSKLHVNGDTRLHGSLFLTDGGDPTLKVYSGRTVDAKNDGSICFLTSIDGTDGESHSYPTSYLNRCTISLQPRGGSVYIGHSPSDYNSGYKLDVNGTAKVSTLTITNDTQTKHLMFSRGGYNYITAPSGGNISFVVNGQAVKGATPELVIENNCNRPGTTNITSLGDSDYRWSNVYSVLGNFSSTLTASSINCSSYRTSDGTVILRHNGTDYNNTVLSATGATMYLRPNGDGNTNGLVTINTSGNITSAGFIKSGSSSSYVLLGDGSHKALSDFVLETEFPLTTITKSLAVTTDWMDTGITMANLGLSNGNYGSFIVLMYCDANNDGFDNYYCVYSGIMSAININTNDGETDEIVLHRAGHGYAATLYLRTLMVLGSSAKTKIQIAASTAFTKAKNIIFKFKRVI